MNAIHHILVKNRLKKLNRRPISLLPQDRTAINSTLFMLWGIVTLILLGFGLTLKLKERLQEAGALR
jgi:hypothetical protein